MITTDMTLISPQSLVSEYPSANHWPESAEACKLIPNSMQPLWKDVARSESQKSPLVDQAYALGVQAYVWGYPMVVMAKSRDAMTLVGDAAATPEQFDKTGKLFAPVNQIANAWGMLGPMFSAIQSANSDTQYSVTWFDSSVEPYVLHVPDMKGRYYTFQFIDAFTNNFHYASTRTMGSQDQSYLLAGPGWKGIVPAGVTRVDCPTPTGFIIGRTFGASESDVASVNALQKQVTMTPLSGFGKTYDPPKVPVVFCVVRLVGELAEAAFLSEDSEAVLLADLALPVPLHLVEVSVGVHRRPVSRFAPDGRPRSG